jgi:hypothetical protein
VYESMLEGAEGSRSGRSELLSSRCGASDIACLRAGVGCAEVEGANGDREQAVG